MVELAEELRRQKGITMTTCNMCGEPCELRIYKEYKVDEKTNQIICEFDGEVVDDAAGLIDCKVSGGYHSTAGNGYGALDDSTSYRFSLCEFCLDWLFDQFKIHPATSNYVADLFKIHSATSDYVAGGISDEPWKPAAKRVKEDDWRRMKEGFFKEYHRRAALRKG